MSSKPRTVESVRAEIISAITEVRSVAQAEHDESRQTTADLLLTASLAGAAGANYPMREPVF